MFESVKKSGTVPSAFSPVASFEFFKLKLKEEKDSFRINCNSFSPVSLLTRILIRSLCNDHPRTATLKRNLTSFAETTSAYLNRILGDATSLFFNLYLNLCDCLCMCNETVITINIHTKFLLYIYINNNEI